ncbi:MAG: 2-oxoglutarate dehydrogenase complex dihydrolipoyllysine-residue succinyltransferase, partial [Rhizobiales bacterium]|nr:2-oxoglutarate dehydrogenase complex dihydrolipoyllysine-residue succinyltransferase [Hyphomicrobiales bacterium]
EAAAAATAVPARATTNSPAANTLSPSVAKLAAESGVSAQNVAATGPKGNVTKGDMLGAIANPPAAPAPVVAVAPRDLGPREERVKMTRLRKTIANRLKEVQNTAAMLTTFNEVDMTAVMAMRTQYKELFLKKHGTKLGFMSFFVKAVTSALKDIPAVNAEIDGGDIIYKNYYNVAVAVGTDKGLFVPVLRDCDQLSFAGVESAIVNYAKAARDGKLSMDDMQGGTFTITNGGVYGSLMSTPILNAPQSGILGMHKIQERPMVVDGKIEIRPMMYLALSYDHRIVDGKEAVTFLVRVKEALEDPQRLVLDL